MESAICSLGFRPGCRLRLESRTALPATHTAYTGFMRSSIRQGTSLESGHDLKQVPVRDAWKTAHPHIFQSQGQGTETDRGDYSLAEAADCLKLANFSDQRRPTQINQQSLLIE